MRLDMAREKFCRRPTQYNFLTSFVKVRFARVQSEASIVIEKSLYQSLILKIISKTRIEFVKITLFQPGRFQILVCDAIRENQKHNYWLFFVVKWTLLGYLESGKTFFSCSFNFSFARISTKSQHTISVASVWKWEETIIEGLGSF